MVQKIYKEAMTTKLPSTCVTQDSWEVRVKPKQDIQKNLPKKYEIKMLGEKKPKWKILSQVKETFRYREEMISVTTDFLSKISEGRRQLDNILLKRKKKF